MGKQVFVNLIADKLDKRVRVEADEDSRLDDLSEFLAEMLVRDSKSIPNAIFSYSQGPNQLPFSSNVPIKQIIKNAKLPQDKELVLYVTVTTPPKKDDVCCSIY